MGQTHEEAVRASASATPRISPRDIADAYLYLLGRLLVLRQEHLDFRNEGFRWNVFVHRKPGAVSWANPNLDVAYSEAWVAVDDNSSTVIDIPAIAGRYYTVQILNVWGETIANLNERTYRIIHPERSRCVRRARRLSCRRVRSASTCRDARFGSSRASSSATAPSRRSSCRTGSRWRRRGSPDLACDRYPAVHERPAARRRGVRQRAGDPRLGAQHGRPCGDAAGKGPQCRRHREQSARPQSRRLGHRQQAWAMLDHARGAMGAYGHGWVHPRVTGSYGDDWMEGRSPTSWASGPTR